MHNCCRFPLPCRCHLCHRSKRRASCSATGLGALVAGIGVTTEVDAHTGVPRPAGRSGGPQFVYPMPARVIRRIRRNGLGLSQDGQRQGPDRAVELDAIAARQPHRAVKHVVRSAPDAMWTSPRSLLVKQLVLQAVASEMPWPGARVPSLEVAMSWYVLAAALEDGDLPGGPGKDGSCWVNS